MTLGDACVRYYFEVAQYNAAPDTALADFERLEKLIGRKTKLHKITNDTIAKAVAKRRGQNVKDTDRLVSNGTVNKSFTKRLSAILTRASKIWDIKTDKKVNCSSHLLREKQERVRELTTEEEQKIFAAMREDYQPFAYFLLYTGCRRAEALNLSWRDIDWRNNEFTITGKGDKTRTLHLPGHVAAVLRNQPKADQEHVFTYISQRGRDKGTRKPITASGYRAAFDNARTAAKIEDFRSHDFRHTAATRVLRAPNNNIKVVQKMLGHSDIATTTRYAHIQKSDIVNAMESISPAKSPANNITSEFTKQNQ